jgi:hypothetical protein
MYLLTSVTLDSLCCRLLSRRERKGWQRRELSVVVGPIVRSDGPRGARVPAPLFTREIGVEIPGPPMGVKTREYSGGR